jgi:phosphonate metabolism protein (transferase hexapeptide repeat family)
MSGPKRHSSLASRDGAPRIHPSARLRQCSLGRFTEIAERVVLHDCTLGDYSYIERNAEAIYAAIGKFTAIAANVRVNALEHPIERISQHKLTYRANEYFLGAKLDAGFRDYRQRRKVVIGHDVWIGHGAIIMPDIGIGNGAVVGAGAVVTRDVAPYAVVAGVPARQLRWRFEPALAGRIEALAWWHWEHDRLAGAVADMADLTAAEFVAKYAV